MLQWFALRGVGRVGVTDGPIDKLLSHAIHTHVLDAKLIPVLLQAARATLFPNNALGPPRTIPSAEEQLEIQRCCADSILSLIPDTLQSVYFGATAVDHLARIAQIQSLLDIFSDAYCNRHLMYAIIELFLIRLMPELGEMGVSELWKERLN